MSDDQEIQISEDQLPTHLERLFLMFHWILDDDPKLQGTLNDIGYRLESAGEDEHAMEKPLEEIWRVENSIFEKYAHALKLERFDIFPEDDEDLDDIRRRFMLQCIINYLEDKRCDEPEEILEDDFQKHNDALVEKAQEIEEKLEDNYDTAVQEADELLRYYEDVFVFDYYGFDPEDDEPQEKSI